ncbi:MAG: hypothetical protein HY717_07980 [Planctomycetes bacterium]|nr:hypothetical protein [Planctomycetota bacterium]
MVEPQTRKERKEIKEREKLIISKISIHNSFLYLCVLRAFAVSILLLIFPSPGPAGGGVFRR